MVFVKQLPLPSLEDTLPRYLAAVEPLLDPAELARTRAAVAEFAEGVGPACQEELERYGEQESADGHSWLSRAWLDSYLTVRTPLPLSSSVAFDLAWPASGGDRPGGVARAAEVVHAFAEAHLAHLRGEVPADETPRGDPIDMQQWVVAAGGIRHPRPERDEWRPGPTDPAGREVGVLWRGRCLFVPVSDAEGRALPAATIAAALEEVVALPAAEEDVAALSSLGSERVAPYLDDLLADPDNRAAYDRLTAALFMVRLDDEPAEPAAWLRRCVFEPGSSWAYKPLTYQVSLVEDHVGVQLEHSVSDGATVASLIARAQAAAGAPTEPAGEPPRVDELTWIIEPAVREAIAADLAAHREEVAAHRIRIERVPSPVPDGLRFSVDAAQQWLMLHAQLATYGWVRSTYEAVDMREYAAGRTECLRPNTTPAVVLAAALADGTATPEQVTTAAEAHREAVKAAKSGRAVDRHLLALGLAAERLGVTSPLHEDEGYRRLTTDFLSTTSLGARGQILRCGFAPTTPGGIGFYYAADGDALEFTVSWREDQAERVDEVVAQLHRGATTLAVPLRALAG